ncbi:flagellar filament capping protein FliD [Clostridium tyrobutyricum]|uniref:flagellar filament capping protein FliD n=1 Tax=Clostridium tyrobutyricum TaxID=1519 RepID=UPI002B1F4EDC|nr:flagellar filament capping protein FliD [Clostridium tyrobutyricum]MEA5009360.1 flagellar filament capping protein FliD [Clostridium tyrobutyricum]
MADSTSSIPVGTTGAGGGNMLRITGLNTGLDVDAMVKKMLTADQTKIDNAKKQQQLIQWRQEAYQSIISDVKDLQSAYFDITNSSNCLLSSGSYNNMVASSSDTNIASAMASTTSVAGSYKILVSKLATSASIQGTGKVVASDGKTAATTSTTLTGTGSNGLGLGTGSYSLKLTYGDNKSTTVNLTVTSTSTINDLITAIKTQTNGAVTAKLDDLTGKFSIQTSATGSSSNLKIENVSSSDTTATTLLAKFNISIDATNGVSGIGENALFAIKEPGSSNYIGGENSSNNFVVNGVSYSLSDVNTTASISAGSVVTPGTSDTPVSISVTQDTSKVHDLITNFIDKYNNLVGEIQDKLQEKKDYNYSPLTDTQKSSMSDTDITNWNNKAKQGILRNDDNLENLLNQLTSAFSANVVDGNGNKVSTLYFGSIGSNSIGIDTSSDVTQGGKISITDDQKFTDALTNNADEIMKLFTTTPEDSDSINSTAKFAQSGIFQRINDIINSNVGMIGTTLNNGTLTKYANLQDDYSVSGGAGTGTLPDQIYQQQLLISTLTDRMNDDQTKYYNQFTQLETAMEQLSAQQSTISAYFSS